MIFNLITKAKQLFFDDSKAKTGADDVQGAIEGVQSNVENVQDDVREVEKKTVYGGEGTEFLMVNSSGNIVNTIFYPTSSKLNLFNSEVIKCHDSVLRKLISNLSGIVIEEKTASQVSLTASGGGNFTVNVAKSGYVCINACIRSTGSYNAVVVGGGLTSATSFTGTIKNLSTSALSTYPIVSCTYLKV